MPKQVSNPFIEVGIAGAPRAVRVLRAASKVAAADDIPALASAAKALLIEMVPGADVSYRAVPDDNPGAAAYTGTTLTIPVSGGNELSVRAPRHRASQPIVRGVASLVQVCANQLRRRLDLAASIGRLADSERLQVALFQIARLASDARDLGYFYTSVHGIVGNLLYAPNFYIAILSQDGTEVAFPYSVDEHDTRPQPRKLARGLTEYVLRHGAPVLATSSDVEELARIGEVVRNGTLAASWLGVPLLVDGRAAGVLAVQSYLPAHRYTHQDQDLLAFVATHVADALARVRATEALRAAYADLERRVDARTRELAQANAGLRAEIAARQRIQVRLRHEALHDTLTDLPNRALLAQRLESALRRYRANPTAGFAVLFMDLDHFKVVNDSAGHHVGDELLVAVGQRVRACLKATDVVARLGGDEFGVLLEGASDAATAAAVADRLIARLHAPFHLASKDLFTATSVGIVLAAPGYRSPAELLRDADAALYRAKAEGRGCRVVFDDALRQQVVARLAVENDLRGAVQRQEFVPYYQPIVDLECGTVIGYEALLRWRHPQRGVLLPDEFLAVAEDAGVSEAIDWQIFEQACRDANALAGAQEAFLAVNLSARHFRSVDLDQRLLGMLAEYHVPATRFRVEITERTLLNDTSAVKRALGALRQAGVGISLDDFGTGFSALSYLHQYPLQSLKIDRSFIAGLGKDGDGVSDAVVRAILAMASALSLQVISEGVETEQQRELLVRMGCHNAQGFLYSCARPAEMWIGKPALAPTGQAGSAAMTAPLHSTTA